MELLRFLFFSSLEYIPMIIFMFAIFRFSFRSIIPQTVFICLLMSLFSHTVRNTEIAQYAAVLQLILFIVCIWLLYRVHWFYSMVMGVIGYQSYITFQAFFIVMFTYSGLASIEELHYGSIKGIILLICSVGVPLLISYFLHRSAWGFTFVPTGNSIKVKLAGFNLVIFLLSLLSIVIIGALNYFYVSNMISSFFVLSLIQLVILTSMIYYSIKKERLEI